MGRLGPLKWIVLIAIVALVTYEYLGKRSGPAVGEAAPDFTVPTWGQGDFTLSDHKGKIIVLDFWATWCPPCKASLPALQRVHRTHQGEADLLIASVNTDRGPAQQQVVPAFMKQRRYDFSVLFDQGMRISQTYNVKSIPTMVVVGRDGAVRAVQVGLPSNSVDGIEAHLEKWIAEAREAEGAEVATP